MDKQQSRFSTVEFDEVSKMKQQNFFNIFTVLESLINETMPSNLRATNMALVSLEEAHAWINKAIRDEQIIRAGTEKPANQAAVLANAIPAGMKQYKTTFFFKNLDDEPGDELHTRWFQSWSITKEKAIEIHTREFYKVETDLDPEVAPTTTCEEIPVVNEEKKDWRMVLKVYKRCDICNGQNSDTRVVDVTMFGISTQHEVCDFCVERVSINQLHKMELATAAVAHGWLE